MKSINSDCRLNVRVGLVSKGATLGIARIQEQHSYVDVFHLVRNLSFVILNGAQCGEIKVDGSRLHLVLCSNSREFLVHFGLRPAHNANVELLSGQLLANF